VHTPGLPMPMTAVQPCPLPADALLARYTDAGYVDCYTATVSRGVSHAEFVETFYTGAVFKLERWLLTLVVARPSTDEEAKELASGSRADFAAWRVEDRAADQLLMCDIGGRTRSWLMVSADPGGAATRLYFGSAVVPARRPTAGKPRMGIVFAALLRFHKLYSRVLLAAAHARLAQSRGAGLP
jgi:hypothetical protein